MKDIGIITIHRIFNYGSVLQSYALQNVCEERGYSVEIIDYQFPNEFHRNQFKYDKMRRKITVKSVILKLIYGYALYKQHKRITKFVRRFLNLSDLAYSSPEDLKNHPPEYRIYITGSDQVWNPRYCLGDPAFLLHFVPENGRKISFAASFGINKLEGQACENFSYLLRRYHALSVREESGKTLIRQLINREAEVVLDPTLLLTDEQWGKIAVAPPVKGKYILCYYLNYSFDAFPYADELAQHIHTLTGYKIVRIARPPVSISNPYTTFEIGASPEEFLGWIKNAALVLTTSFHGTAFALNFSVPVFSIVESKNSVDSRQVHLLKRVGLKDRLLALFDPFPALKDLECNYSQARIKLKTLRENSLNFLYQALEND